MWISSENMTNPHFLVDLVTFIEELSFLSFILIGLYSSFVLLSNLRQIYICEMTSCIYRKILWANLGGTRRCLNKHDSFIRNIDSIFKVLSSSSRDTTWCLNHITTWIWLQTLSVILILRKKICINNNN